MQEQFDPRGHILQCFEGTRRGSTIFHGGNGFFYHLTTPGKNRRFDYYRCVRYDSVIPCRGRAFTVRGGMRLVLSVQHNHEPDLLYPLEIALRAAIMKRVRSGDPLPYHEIITEEGQRGRYPVAVRARLHPARLRSAMYKARLENLPPIPPDLGDLGYLLTLPEFQYITQMNDGESIYAGMCGNVANRTLSLVFISPTMRDFLGSRQQVFSDATFKTRPGRPDSAQIWNIIGLRRGHILPALRAIMMSKLESAYTLLLRFIRQLIPTFNPQTVMCDHERGQINAWRRIFVAIRILTCLWHYARAVTMKAKELGLTGFLNDFDEAKSIVRALCALPLLPSELIGHGLVAVGNEALTLGFMEELRPLFQYMEDTWLPMQAVLSVYGSQDRTNNACESANNSLKEAVKVMRPNFWVLIGAFKVTEDRAKVDLETLRQLGNPSRKRKSSALANEVQINALWADLASGEIGLLRFLHSASRRLQTAFEEFLTD